MAIEQMFTSLPNAGTASMSDIICAVQGYVSPSNLGLSVQENLQQVFDLFKSNLILSNAGNPNGLVAGTTYQLCWDTLNNVLYVCTVTGDAVTAVWTKSIQLTAGVGITITQNASTIQIASSSVLSNFLEVAGTFQPMAVNTTYQPVNVSLTTLLLPPSANLGELVRVTGFGAGGWTITQNPSQQIIMGNTLSTIGAGGSASSTNQYDGIELVCTDINTTWQTVVAPQGMINIV